MVSYRIKILKYLSSVGLKMKKYLRNSAVCMFETFYVPVNVPVIYMFLYAQSLPLPGQDSEIYLFVFDVRFLCLI